MGLWHLRFNLLKLIHKIHWGDSFPIDQSCLQYAADRWNRTNLKNNPDFRKLEELLIHSYHSRILGLLLHLTKHTFDRAEDAEENITNLDAEHFEKLVKELVSIVNPLGFDKFDNSPPVNEQVYNHQCFIRHMDVYFLLTQSIHCGDIGLLKQALRETTLLFQAKAARSENYGPELLRLLHICDSEAASARLRRAIIKSMLVNLAGKDGKTFEVDRLVEFLNRMVSITKKARISSTKPTEDLLRQITLTAPYALRVKAILEQTFGRRYSGHHPTKVAAEDLWLMATVLARDTFGKMEEPDHFTAYPTVNLRCEGLRSLGENVQRHNEKATDGPPISDDMEGDDDQDVGNLRVSREAYSAVEDTIDDVMDNIMAEAY